MASKAICAGLSLTKPHNTELQSCKAGTHDNTSVGACPQVAPQSSPMGCPPGGRLPTVLMQPPPQLSVKTRGGGGSVGGGGFLPGVGGGGLLRADPPPLSFKTRGGDYQRS